MNEVLKTIKSRRSIRKFKPDQIRPEDMELILEAAIYAPSGHNDQPWHFTVIQNPALLDEINVKAKKALAGSPIEWMKNLSANESLRLTYDAPTLVVVSGRVNAVSSRTDCDAAIQNMLLAAESLGIGSVWLGLLYFYFQQKEEIVKLGIPDGYEPYYAVSFGYHAGETAPVAPKRNRDVVNFIR